MRVAKRLPVPMRSGSPLWVLALSALLLGNTPLARAWTSAKAFWSEDIHQHAIDVVLHSFFLKNQLDVLEAQQQIIDKDQDAAQSDEHSMTGISDASQNDATMRAQFIARTEQLLQTNFGAARSARKSGNIDNSLVPFAKALHALEDATSPAHRAFQDWKDSFGIWEMAQHVLKERAYPQDDKTHFYKSRLENVVQYAYDIYSEKIPIPPRFFDRNGCLLQFDPDCLKK